MKRQWKLWYEKPACKWNEALPLGDGAFGAMLYGKTGTESIPLNIDTLWSGFENKEDNTRAIPDWDSIRSDIFAGKHADAEKKIKDQALGEWTQGYLPAGNLNVIREEENAEEYRRYLLLNKAVCGATYKVKGVSFETEAFVSYQDHLLVLKIKADAPAIRMKISLTSPVRSELKKTDVHGGLWLTGRAPSRVWPNYVDKSDPVEYTEGKGICFFLGLMIQQTGGMMTENEDSWEVKDASEVTIFVSGDTDFYHPGILSDQTEVFGRLKEAASLGYVKLMERHEKAFAAYFDRVELSLGDDKDDLPTDERLRRQQAGGEDADLSALLFHYGRYLMISASRPGTECANLQGIWNDKMRPPWSSNYTVNINTEMNYWPVEVCGLSECHEPLFALLERTMESGKKTARKLYGLDGWVLHHNVDIWGHAWPVGAGAADNPCQYGMWMMGSGWLCRHLFEHYDFTRDKEFLKDRAYPLMREAVKFYLGFLTPYDGYLVTVPSTSPENQFISKDNTPRSVSLASTMDISIIKDLFSNYVITCNILGMEDEYADKAEEALLKLPPFKTGRHGQLQEWYHDEDETDVHHRHVSHLYGLYPGDIIRDAELIEACKVSLNRRGDDGTGWCIAWKSLLWARLGDGERALKLLKRQMNLSEADEVVMEEGGTYPNLFCAHPPFQIDGNFGATAAIAEMLVQSHSGEIKLLPALPLEWRKGSVRGLRLRGGKTLAMDWADGKIVWSQITSAGNGNLPLTREDELVDKE